VNEEEFNRGTVFCFVFTRERREFFCCCGKHYMEVENQRFLFFGLEYFFLRSFNKRPAIISAPCAFLLRIVTAQGCDSSWTRVHTGTKNFKKKTTQPVVFAVFL